SSEGVFILCNILDLLIYRFYITSKADYEFCGKNSSIFPIDFSLKTAYTESRNNPTFPIL
ncbi:MAG: hypothetical protein Q4C84_00005, partial [Bacillota bacterium]|nr:hypothetical protein [Bacillota bacterium]